MYDVIVVGGGHAGVEAAVAAAKLNKKTALVSGDLSRVAFLSCNPAIGGPAKGIVVREMDALGGVMGKVADLTAIQMKMLNKSKGPAVWALINYLLLHLIIHILKLHLKLDLLIYPFLQFPLFQYLCLPLIQLILNLSQIGRASCRERV